MPPEIDEIAQILYKIVERDRRRRLVITSAALREEDVHACFGPTAGYLSTYIRRWGLEREVVALIELSEVSPMCAELILAALRGMPHRLGGAVACA